MVPSEMGDTDVISVVSCVVAVVCTSLIGMDESVISDLGAFPLHPWVLELRVTVPPVNVVSPERVTETVAFCLEAVEFTVGGNTELCSGSLLVSTSSPVTDTSTLLPV